MAFMLLYWTGMRIGELLALTYEDIDLEKRIISISKSYQRLDGKDVITPPKTPKSNRTDIDDVDTEICRKDDVSVADKYSDIEKEQADLYVVESREMDDGDAKQIYTGKNVAVDDEVPVIPMAADKVEWIADRLSESGAYEDVDVPVKADIFGFDIADVSGNIRPFSDVMKRMGIKLAGDELYEELQRIYDVSVGRDAGKEKAEDKIWNMHR